jgi:hypothetical protein
MGNGVRLPSVAIEANGRSTGRPANKRDLPRRTTKASDVVSNPFNSKPLVEQTRIPGKSWIAWEAKDIEAIINCHDHNVLSISEVLTLVERRVSVPDIEP